MKRTIVGMAVVLVLCQAVLFAEENWKEYQPKDIIIYYKDAPLSFVQSLQESAESYYREIIKNLGFARYSDWQTDRPIRIYIYDDQDDYASGAHQAGWSHGAAMAQAKIIRTFPAVHGFFDSILPHEMGHIIFREFIGYKTQLPVWVDEGVAMYQEKAKRWGAHKMVKKAMENHRFMTLGQLSTMRLGSDSLLADVELFYAEAASVVYFMIVDLGETRFVNFCRKLRAGSSFEEALKEAYGRFRNVDDLNRAWLNYLERQ